MIGELVRAVREPAARAWLDEQIAAAGDLRRVAPAFAAAGRRLGRALIAPEDAAAITAAGLRWPVTGADECGRAALVIAAARALPADGRAGFVRDLVRRGEVRERQA